MNNQKSPHQTINDYLARTCHILTDLHHQDAYHMPDGMFKYHLLYGLSDENKWKNIATLINQRDVDNTWSTDKLKQY